MNHTNYTYESNLNGSFSTLLISYEFILTVCLNCILLFSINLRFNILINNFKLIYCYTLVGVFT